MEEQPQIVQPKPRHHWFRIILITLLIVTSLATIGCFAARTEFDKHVKEKAEGTAESFCETDDKEAPEITLNGNGAITLKVGEEYEELGATAIDSCEEVEVVISGTVDIEKEGTYKLTYSSMDSLQNASKKERVVTVVPKYSGTIYLTFDDGPWTNTGALLDMLKKFAAEKNSTPAQISLAYLMCKNDFVVPIPGMRRDERLKENFGAADVVLDKNELAALEDALSKITIHGDRKDSDIMKLGTVKTVPKS